MRRIPPLNGLVSLYYKRSQWYAGSEVQWAASQTRLAQGDKDDNRIPAGGTPGWQVWNVHAGYTGNVFQIRLSCINLLNADYRTHGSGINNMGRGLTASAMVHF
jgi:outer membrane receptor protein involved in Fe transport